MSSGITSQIISQQSEYSTLTSLNELELYALKDLNIFYTLDTVQDSLDYTRLLVYGFDAINNMILNVVHTVIGERDFEPTFGSRSLHIVHEPNDSIVANTLELELYDRIRYWVPYIDIALSGIICRTVPNDQAYLIYFVYNEKVSGIQNTFSTYLGKVQKVKERR